MRASGLYLLAILVLLAALTGHTFRPRKERHHRHHHGHGHHRHKENGKKHRHKQFELEMPRPKESKVDTIVPINNISKIPISRDIAVEGEMFFFAKYVQCPRHKELMCKDHWCSKLTCEDSELYRPFLCPRIPSKCDNLYCGCAKSQGYFQLSPHEERCITLDNPECGSVKYVWQPFNSTHDTVKDATKLYVSAGSGAAPDEVLFVMRAKSNQNLYPGKYKWTTDGFVVDLIKPDTYGDIKVDEMEILLNNQDFKWVDYNSSNIPREALKAGMSYTGIPQYIGRKILSNAEKKKYTVLGRVQFGRLLHMDNGKLEIEEDFEILCANRRVRSQTTTPKNPAQLFF